ncbi:MAG: glycosyltransferase family 39 protein [Chloroflexi bacterium]|nr:glycosyltransferase family 39 protein [Chloroflexota bacterium]
MSDELQPTNSPEEPSVLDYVKSLFRFGKAEKIQLPSFVEEEQAIEAGESTPLQPSAPSLHPSTTPFPWRSLLALVLALIGQRLFDSSITNAPLGYGFYLGALSLLGWAIHRKEWNLAPHAATAEGTDPLRYRRLALILGVGFAVWAFILFKYFTDNLFTAGNLLVWIIAVALFTGSLWLNQTSLRNGFQKFAASFQRDPWTINISHWTVLLIAATALVFFFRFHQTTAVPPEPFSDQAEKILDVYDVSQGKTSIFFTRNTGREAFQMYWTLLVANVFGTGLSYLSLKLGTAILGFLTLPFIYLLGREIGGKRVGLFAFILTGIGYWPNVISRVGLRFPLYPLFAAPTLFFLIRGLRTRNRNDFLLSGLFLGLGLHGYSPMRIVPFIVVAAFVLYWLHSQSKGARRELPLWLTMLALVSLFVFLPLLAYWVGHPSEFGFRAMTRLTSTESQITEPVLSIFASNVWKALKMFNFDDGEIWVHSIPHRPALDVVSAALFVIGAVLVLVRYIRTRHWLDLFLLVSIPLLQLPSTLSIAFPAENPALNRAGGAYIPAFLLGAMALDGLLTSLGRGRVRNILVWIVAGVLLYSSAAQNYDLVFNKYYRLFRQSSWNTSDMGAVVKEFEQTYGRTDTVWIVPFPHWVDTRLPAVWAGIPNRDMAVWRDELPTTVAIPGPKLFMVKADTTNPLGNDEETLNVLQSLYPNGQLRLQRSDITGHDFWIFFVPGQ